MAHLGNEHQFSDGRQQQIVANLIKHMRSPDQSVPVPVRSWYQNTFTSSVDEKDCRNHSRRAGEAGRKKTWGGLTDHVDGGPSGPHTRMLLDGVVESGLTELNSRHTDPEAQAEQPRHDRTHLLKRWSQKKYTSCSQPMTSQKKTKNSCEHATHVVPESCAKLRGKYKINSTLFTNSLICNWLHLGGKRGF